MMSSLLNKQNAPSSLTFRHCEDDALPSEAIPNEDDVSKTITGIASSGYRPPRNDGY
jgi:hypothetical protein